MSVVLGRRDGPAAWRHRLGGDYWASPILVEGRIYFFSESGAATVVQPGKEFKELAVNHLDGTIMSTPAIAGHAFFVRTTTNMYRIESRSQTALKTAGHRSVGFHRYKPDPSVTTPQAKTTPHRSVSESRDPPCPRQRFG